MPLFVCSLNTLDLSMASDLQGRFLSAEFSTWSPCSASFQPFFVSSTVPQARRRSTHDPLHMHVKHLPGLAHRTESRRTCGSPDALLTLGAIDNREVVRDINIVWMLLVRCTQQQAQVQRALQRQVQYTQRRTLEQRKLCEVLNDKRRCSVHCRNRRNTLNVGRWSNVRHFA